MNFVKMQVCRVAILVPLVLSTACASVIETLATAHRATDAPSGKGVRVPAANPLGGTSVAVDHIPPMAQFCDRSLPSQTIKVTADATKVCLAEVRYEETPRNQMLGSEEKLTRSFESSTGKSKSFNLANDEKLVPFANCMTTHRRETGDRLVPVTYWRTSRAACVPNDKIVLTSTDELSVLADDSEEAAWTFGR